MPEYFIFNSTLEQAMKMYWRVKTWRVTVTVSGRTVGGISNGQYVEYFYKDAESEEDLVCPGVGLVLSDPWGNIGGEFAFQLFPNTNGTSLAAFFLFKPGDDSGEYVISSIQNTFFNTLGGQISLENFGPGGTCNFYIPNNLLPEYGGLGLSIRAHEYWSYGGTYDTATGEPVT